MPPQQPAPLRVAIYTRISSDDQGHAIGVTDQAVQCRKLIAEHFPGAVIAEPACRCRKCQDISAPADVYCDNDLSASGLVDRPHYDRLVDDIRAGLIDAVVAVDVDRLHRHLMTLEGYINACEPRDVRTYTVKSGRYDLSTPGGRAHARILGVVARYEWEQMVERQKSAKRRNREAGLRTSGIAPFGYRLDHATRGEGNKQIPGTSTGLVIEPEEAKAVADACRKVLAGGSLSEIARMWNKAGLTTARGNSWTVINVRQILLQPANAALITYPRPRDDQVIGGAAWEPIIDEDTWRALRTLLTDPSRRTGPGPKPRNLLTGVLICGKCDGTRFATTPSSRPGRPRTVSYICVSHLYRGDGGGTHLGRKMAALDAYAMDAMRERVRRPDAAAAFTRTVPDFEELIAERNKIQAQLDEWAADEDITPREYKIRKAKLQPRLDEAQKKLDDANVSSAAASILGALFAAGEDPGEVLDSLPVEGKRAVAAKLLRIRLLPTGKGGGNKKGYRRGEPRPVNPDFVEIIWQDA